MSLSLHLNLGDGVTFTRFCVFLVLAYPTVASFIIYLFKRKIIKRTALYFLASIALNYIVAILWPTGLVFGLIIFGNQAEVASLYTLFLTPLLIILLPISSVIIAKKFI
jgi:hypothetical protein